MRVTAVTLSYPPHRRIGAELAVHSLMKRVVARGHQATVVTTQEGPVGVYDGVKVGLRLGPNKVTDPCDVVFTNAGLGMRVHRWYRKPMVLWAHNNQLVTLQDVWSTWLLGNVQVLANTQHMADVMQSTLSIRAHVLHPPVELGSTTCRGTAITMVNCSPAKGSDVFWRLAERNPHQQFIAVRGGYGSQDIRDHPNVIVFDHTDDLEPVWAQTRVLLLPSRAESYSMVAVEAASRGIPAVATDLPGVREALGDGAIYVYGDLHEWATGLAQAESRWEFLSKEAHANSVRRARQVEDELDKAVDLMERLAGDRLLAAVR